MGSSSLIREAGPPELGVQSLSHWTTGEVPYSLFTLPKIMCFPSNHLVLAVQKKTGDDGLLIKKLCSSAEVESGEKGENE